ncbi:MAG: sulfatase [Bacteroidota bacterium]
MKDRFFLFIIAFFGSICFLQAQATKPNVLFICVDDLRPELGCYGQSYIKSPNLDKLAGESYLFKQHFVTVPTCGASRYSMLTGKLPQTVSDVKNSAFVSALQGKPESEIPESFIHHLKRNGYYTIGIGKISHHPDGKVYGYTEPVSKKIELPYSWDELIFDYGKWGTGHNAFFGYANGTNRNTLNKQVRPYEKADVDDTGYPDGIIAELAIDKLRQAKERDQPFFLGVGFFKPHLPFTAPSKYWNLYDTVDIPLSPNNFLPEYVSRSSLQNNGEFNNYQLGEEKATLEKSISAAYAKKLRHAYAACVSYVDAQIGKVLNELNDLGLAENTVVVVWGDHGWHLGDHLIWGKHTILERALHATLIIKTPDQNQNATINKIVSSIDIYPTLMELCGTNMPYKTKGRSLLPLFSNPTDNNWEEAAYSYFRNGISLRTERFRFNKYNRDDLPIELFDHETDPNETVNIAENNQDTIEELMPVWEKGNTRFFEK